MNTWTEHVNVAARICSLNVSFKRFPLLFGVQNLPVSSSDLSSCYPVRFLVNIVTKRKALDCTSN